MITSTAILAVVTSGFLVVLIGIIVGYMQLKQIHAAVNSNMTTALDKIDELHNRLSAMGDELRHERSQPKDNA